MLNVEGYKSPEMGSRGNRIAPWLLALCGVVFAGTAGFTVIEGWEPWRSLYFTLISITTVGYGDLGISDAGRSFALVILMVGIVIASQTFALVIGWAVTAELAWRKRMQKRIDKLENHTIVCGFGRMGRTICEQLAAAQEPFVIIEQSEHGFQSACELGYLAVNGSASEDDYLLGGGIKRAKHLASAVDREAENLVITLSARELNPDLVILARAEQEDQVRKLRRAGATHVVAPFASGGIEIVNTILRPQTAGFHQLSLCSQSQLTLAEVLVEEGSELVGWTLVDYGRREATRIVFVAMMRPGAKLRVPPAVHETLQPKDVVLVAGDPDEIAVMRERGCAAAEDTSA